MMWSCVDSGLSSHYLHMTLMIASAWSYDSITKLFGFVVTSTIDRWVCSVLG